MNERESITFAYRSHERVFEGGRYVYPVLSRRSSGVSIGINLNLDKICNFDCVYCQVDRRLPGRSDEVSIPAVGEELAALLSAAADRALFDHPKFRALPEALKVVRDIAFSGDGEPSVFPRLPQLAEEVLRVRARSLFPNLPIVMITNASGLHLEATRRALDLLAGAPLAVWAKLDAGTEAYYRKISRSSVPFSRVLKNIAEQARRSPIIIQSLFMRLAGEPPLPEEIEAYLGRLKEIQGAGGAGAIREVQVYTTARRPAEEFVSPLGPEEIAAITARVGSLGIPVSSYYAE